MSSRGVDYADCIAAMNRTLRHRGPDDEGLFTDPAGGAWLAHRRLAIIDLTQGGHQPMSSSDGRFTAILNGEIYNYLELRQELVRLHVGPFLSESDTEVLLAAYRQWGPDCLDRLVGMFAFAVWDRREQQLFVARDRIGKKPLAYYWDGKTLAFASEIKALRVVPGVDGTLDPEAVSSYLALGYIPAPRSVYKSVKKLLPGHFLMLRDGVLKCQRYWHPEQHQSPHDGRRAGDEEVASLIADAVRLRLRSDVPTALFLSGGIDSSVIAVECARQAADIRTITVAFDEDPTDLPYAQSVATHLGYSLETVRVNGGDAVKDFGEIFRQYDEPFADTSNLPSFLIAKATRGVAKVVLNGDGGDEVFGGYTHYEWVAVKQRMKALGSVIGLCDGHLFDPRLTYFQSKNVFRTQERAALLGDKLTDGDSLETLLRADPFLGAYGNLTPLDLAMRSDLHLYLPNDLMFKMDIALMSFGIEGRSPLLDHRLIECALRLDERDRVAGREKKVMLKRLYSDLLPPDVLSRPKAGFGAPIGEWLTSSLRTLVDRCLPTPLFETTFQERLISGFRDGSDKRDAARLWTLLAFALWADEWSATW